MIRQAQSFFRSLIPVHRALQDDIERRIGSEGWAKDAVADKLTEMGGESLSESDFASYAHEAATVYTLKTLFLKVAEDKSFMRRSHVHKVSQRVSVYHELFNSIARNMTWGEYLEYAFRDIAYRDIAFDLFKETPYELVPPGGNVAEKLLKTVDELGDLSGIDTALIGDLYEHLMEEEERKRLGYYTTPDFIIEFLLDRTLEPAFNDWNYSDIRYLDPACGTGHFLVRAYRRFLKKYRNEEPEMSEMEIFKRVMESNIFGIDVSEFAARITLFRLMLEGLDAQVRDAERGDTREFTDISFNVFVANSLIILPSEGILAGIDKPLTYEEDSQARYYKKEVSHLKVDLADALNHKFHVINANPPYVRVQRNTEDISVPHPDDSWIQMDYLEYLRVKYDSAHGSFDISVPFLERCINLLSFEGKGGYLGLITSGKFTKRDYGKKIVELLDQKTVLKFVADLTDAKIFNASAYPILLILRHGNVSHPDKKVEVLATYQPRGNRSETWKYIESILTREGNFHFDETIGWYFEKQTHFKHHPWTYKRSEREILLKITKASDETLGDITDLIGFDFISGADPVFAQFITESFIHRKKLEREILIPCLRGANVRDWTVDWHGNKKDDGTYAIYTLVSSGVPVDIGIFPQVAKYLEKYKDALESRADGWERKPISQTNTPWYIVFKRLYQAHVPKLIFPCTAMYAHFFLDDSGKHIAKQTCQVIYVQNMERSTYLILTAILNSSLCNYFIKQKSSRIQRGYYDFSKRYIEQMPVVQPEGEEHQSLISMVNEMISLARQAMSFSMNNLICREKYESIHELQERQRLYIGKYRSIQARMSDIQNDMDHLIYRIYGITEPEDIAELEQSLYKRPWSEPSWEKEFRFEAQDCINDLIEDIFAKQQSPNETPLSIQNIGSELAAIPKAEALRGVYYQSGLQLMPVFAKECMDTDCRTIPFDEEAAKVGRGAGKVDILHERFFRFDELDENLYGWTGWSSESQLNVFLKLAQRAKSEGKSPEPFRSWIEKRVLPNIEDEQVKKQARFYLSGLLT